jgi:ribonuclease HI
VERLGRRGRPPRPRRGTGAAVSRVTVNVDGGARGNPGPAAIGVVLRGGDGEVLEKVGEKIGEATNNVAEYRALLRGIELAGEHGASELELVGDSELVVRQVEGRYKVKNAGMKELYDEVVRALRGFDSWSIRHVRRAENADADRLVNEALDGVLDG